MAEQEFYKTMMGKKYYQKDLPELIASNNRLAAAIEKRNKILERQLKLESKKQINEKKDKTD